MTALVRYLLADVLRTQRYLPPLLVFAAVLAMFNAGDAGPPPSAYAGSTAFLYPVAVWLTIVVATAEDPVRRAVTVVTAGGWGRSQAAVAILSCLLVTVVAAFAALLPVLTQSRPYPPGTVALGFAALLVAGVVGVGVGVLCARPVITQHGWSVLAAAALVVLAYLFGQTPPIGNVLGALGHEYDLVPHLAVSGACAVVLVVGATWLSRTLGPRRN
ncbi:hypothetical protein ABZ816_17020 [Actinosynnema sp. NPDC047251]|uniref:Putative secreted protein n=1 Tax=Saccharothrix espanaensis (strain ATCC 51144 / DSM 44229 / JCM 9112 / NBRC 15066 / NRRL 15764) TaxID=1179773 RepID=K0JRU6_SACES|nr:hypothetical protein [Saccharothrix espanaensis]CCH30400.1 putative secreted protein [Saccharothrix espanaensis DSM 44229]